ncbi:serine dehydratase beta chain [Aneurinibacillus sp. REN35]|uniref:serine dehydratase beta chain n=1 Tax=Aneurinibacillus sp. REN35 TaxID=3237286 RepID=UPI0035284890
MAYSSCFDIIGPIMVGPSSSHTAGVVLIGKFVHDLLHGPPTRAEVTFYGSFAETYRGHGTDKAIVGGLLGLDTHDTQIRSALDLAKEKNIDIRFQMEEDCPYYDHPNTVIVTAQKDDRAFQVGGVSIGGGTSKIFSIDGEALDVLLDSSYT